MKYVARALFALSIACTMLAPAMADWYNPTYRLRSQLTGPAQCLDLTNEGVEYHPVMARCREAKGVVWSMDQAAPGYSRFQNAFTGVTHCLGIINDGTNDKPFMAACGNYTGQMWSMEPIGDGDYVRLRSKFTGPDKCLAVINDGLNNLVRMAPCSQTPAQFWHISKT